MSTELLYPMVSEAIRRAETLEDLGAPGTPSAFLDVSLLEEKIAETLPASDPEGALARRGAVRAALSAGDYRRVRQLVDRFRDEPDLDAEVRDDLLRLSQKARRSSGLIFPRLLAWSGHKIEISQLARSFMMVFLAILLAISLALYPFVSTARLSLVQRIVEILASIAVGFGAGYGLQRRHEAGAGDKRS